MPQKYQSSWGQPHAQGTVTFGPEPINFPLRWFERLLADEKNPKGREKQEGLALRILDETGLGEISARMETRVYTGNITPGDRLALWGRFKNGELVIRRGYNLNTGAIIKLHNR